jgi:hypothetical protein
MQHKLCNEHTGRHSDDQSHDIDCRKRLIARNIPNGGGEIIFEHRFPYYRVTVNLRKGYNVWGIKALGIEGFLLAMDMEYGSEGSN